MGLLDTILGRTKKAAGDLTGKSSLHGEETHEEAAGAAEDAAADHEAAAHHDHEGAAEHRAAADSESPPA
jgi:uncharacterized protein YjbJ (UPF0337 family)